jgi:hypothetical protein
VNQAAAFGVILETEHTEKDSNGNVTRTWYNYDADNQLFIDNVYSRMSALKELGQKDTKTRIVSVYQILVASYHISRVTPDGSLIRVKGRVRRKDAQPVQNGGEVKDGGDEPPAEGGVENRDSGGPPD